MSRTPEPPPVPPRREAPKIKTSVGRRRKRRSQLPILTAAFLFIACVISLAMVIRRTPPMADPPTAPVRSPPVPSQPGSAPSAESSDTTEKPYLTVDDDDATLWEPPTWGDSLPLEHIPQGAKCLVHVNLAALRESEEGQRVLKALGPGMADRVAVWEQSIAVSLSQIASVTFAWIPRPEGKLQLVVRCQPTSNWEVPAQWTPVAARPPIQAVGERFEIEGQHVLVSSTGNQRFWILCPAELLEEFDDLGSPNPPVLQRQLETLRRRSDRQRCFSLLVTANFLWTDGTNAFGLRSEDLLDSLENQLGGGMEAALFGAHVEDGGDFFMELQSVWRPEAMTGGGDELDRRLRGALDTVRKYADSLGRVDRYWSDLFGRVPAMLDLLRGQLRVQREGNLLVANVSLPPAAAHNLTLVAELLLAARPMKAPVPAGPDRGPPALNELLQRTFTYEFGQQSLVEAVQGLEEEVRTSGSDTEGFSIILDGVALRAEGITRNQQIADFRYRDTPLSSILTAIVKQANPEKVATMADSAQKLVWAVEPSEPGADSTVILITTRRAAAERTLVLPDDFANP